MSLLPITRKCELAAAIIREAERRTETRDNRDAAMQENLFHA